MSQIDDDILSTYTALDPHAYQKPLKKSVLLNLAELREIPLNKAEYVVLRDSKFHLVMKDQARPSDSVELHWSPGYPYLTLQKDPGVLDRWRHNSK